MRGHYYQAALRFPEPIEKRAEKSALEEIGEFDAFAGGYPVPPMGDQVLPEFAQVLSGDEDVSSDRPTGEREPGAQQTKEGSEP